jgi:transcriptional regulator with XRE-family HTH domain
MSLQDVATRAHVSAATLSRVETGKQSLDLGLFLQLTRILRVRPQDMLDEVAEAPHEPIVSRLAALSSADRVQFWKELSATHRGPKTRGGDVGSVVEELLAQIDFLRQVVENVRRTFRARRR